MAKQINYGQRTTFFRMLIAAGILTLLVAGVSSCTLPDLSSFLPSNEPTQSQGGAISTPTPNPTPTSSIPVTQLRTLILWVPPQFDPGAGTTAGDLFQSRLDEFTSRRPQTGISVRVKELTGENGLLQSLRITASAAPIITPDLIALPRPMMEQAYQEGLISPITYLSETFQNEDWFNYAVELSQIDDQLMGLPFGGELMVLAYKNDSGEAPPPDWNSVLAIQKPLAFPASDPQSLVTLALYQSLEGVLLDQSGQSSITAGPLLEVLNYYRSAQAANVMPYWLTQFETDLQAWDSYQQRQSTLALTWSSTILNAESPNTSLAPMPTKEGRAYSYASGWVWCLIPSDAEGERLAVELAEFLTAEPYVTDWGLQAGYLPISGSGLESWAERPSYQTLQQLLPVAVLTPEQAILDEVGPPVREAVVAVLKDQIDPETALETLLSELQSP
jgi:ABC-type glycerol-3-phosphate transport system substrate-binding protein